MRRLVLLLCLLLNISFMLAPFSHMHAHLDQQHDSALVHDGHSHDFDAHEAADHDEDHVIDHSHVVDLDGDRAGQVASMLAWAQWLPLLCMAGLLLPLAPSSIVLLPRRRRDRLLFGSQHPPWPPPLRGPPLSI